MNTISDTQVAFWSQQSVDESNKKKNSVEKNRRRTGEARERETSEKRGSEEEDAKWEVVTGGQSSGLLFLSTWS